ncbi:hypothetical protein PCANC_14972 [Puccinia coronata f. sp. avenae]|uniref:CCHC-type domain-containing protein n=1 Tax=Puccinia coronata f. sp. avenae TaxID=200324 RepID=A0A2N5T299_9BASI|nr:hypothetical protein PCANC_14972 [Puccinia coronata f. sp. avenae]
MDVSTIDDDALSLPKRPETRPSPSVFFNYLEAILQDPSRRAQPGYIRLDEERLQMIFKLMNEEITRAQQLQDMFQALKLELANTRRTMERSNASVADVMARVAALEQSAAASHPKAPATSAPPNSIINISKPGQAVIHVAPKIAGMDKIPKGIMIEKDNEALKTLNAQFKGKDVKIKAIQILKSGDVCFILDNRAQQRWLMANKHHWSKKVHPDLTATPSTHSVLLHNVPMSLDITDQFLISKFAMANGFEDADLLRICWLANHSTPPKDTGALILAFVNKEVAKQIEITGLFFDHLHYAASKLKNLPPQCFNCLQMGHFGRWCKETPKCARCGDNHATKDCPTGTGPISTCVMCVAKQRNDQQSVPDVNHDPFKSICQVKQKWLKKKPHAVQ